MKKTRGTKGEVGIKLSTPQRKLLLNAPIFIHEEFAEPIRCAATTAPVMLTLDDWEDLAGHVAAEANHTTDKASARSSTPSSPGSRTCSKRTRTRSRPDL